MPLNRFIERTCTGQATRGFHFIPGRVCPAGSRLSCQTFDQKHKIGHGRMALTQVEKWYPMHCDDGIYCRPGEGRGPIFDAWQPRRNLTPAFAGATTLRLALVTSLRSGLESKVLK